MVETRLQQVSFPLLGEAMWEFSGTDFGDDYMTWAAADAVLLLPGPGGQNSQGWAHGQRCGPAGRRMVSQLILQAICGGCGERGPIQFGAFATTYACRESYLVSQQSFRIRSETPCWIMT